MNNCANSVDLPCPAWQQVRKDNTELNLGDQAMRNEHRRSSLYCGDDDVLWATRERVESGRNALTLLWRRVRSNRLHFVHDLVDTVDFFRGVIKAPTNVLSYNRVSLANHEKLIHQGKQSSLFGGQDPVLENIKDISNVVVARHTPYYGWVTGSRTSTACSPLDQAPPKSCLKLAQDCDVIVSNGNINHGPEYPLPCGWSYLSGEGRANVAFTPKVSTKLGFPDRVVIIHVTSLPGLYRRFTGDCKRVTNDDLLGDSTITTAFQRGAPRGFDEQPELIGYIGMYMNFSLFESTNARIFSSQGSTGADVYVALALGKDAYGVTEIDSDALMTYFQPLGSAGAIDDPLHQVGSIGWKINFTAEILGAISLLSHCLVTGKWDDRGFGGHLSETIPSRAAQAEGVQAMYGPSLWDEDMVGPLRRRGEWSGTRNDSTLAA